MALRILLVNYDYPPMGGGSGKAVACLLREFAAHHPELEVEAVVAGMGAGRVLELSSRIRLHQIDIGKTASIHHQSLAELMRFTMRAGDKARDLLDRGRFDLMHCFFAVPTGWIGYRLRNRLPFIVSLRGSDVPGFNPRFRAAYVALRPVVRLICGKAAAVVANSRGLRDLAAETLPRGEILVVPNGIDAPEPPPKRRVEPGPLQVLFVGRLIPRKGIIHLLRGFAEYVARTSAAGIAAGGPGGEARLILAGSGPQLGELRDLSARLGIGGQVDFLGAVPPERMDFLYRAADVFVLPSLEEGMSNALLEAVAYGLPAIVTATGGTAELVGDNGCIVPRGDPAAIAESLSRLAADPAWRGRMGAAGRETAERFSWRSAADRYAELFAEVAGKNGGRAPGR